MVSVGSVVVVVDEGLVVVVVGGVVVVVDGGAVVVVVVGGRVVVVVGGWLVVVEPAIDAKVHTAVAQSVGPEATTTSTPGMVLNDHTGTAGPCSRQASDGSLVVRWTAPRYFAVPSDSGAATGVSETS